jgi:hypothetical protein
MDPTDPTQSSDTQTPLSDVTQQNMQTPPQSAEQSPMSQEQSQMPPSPADAQSDVSQQPRPSVDPSVAQPPQEQQAQQQQQGDYITNVGRSMVDLLTDISLSDELTKTVADTMRLTVGQVTEILEGLLDKVDNEQVTEEELALIITAPVVDEEPKQNNDNTS